MTFVLDDGLRACFDFSFNLSLFAWRFFLLELVELRCEYLSSKPEAF